MKLGLFRKKGIPPRIFLPTKALSEQGPLGIWDSIFVRFLQKILEQGFPMYLTVFEGM